MRSKITIEEFRRIKHEIADALDEANAAYETLKDKTEEERKEFENVFIEQCLALQNELLSYDLSDIPFEEWEGLEITSDKDHHVDMSQTHANIDFNLMLNQSYINFNGCNVRNLKTNYVLMDERNFDPSVVEAHKEVFIPLLSKPELMEKMFSGSLTMEDLFTLTPEEIYLLKDKKLQLAFHYDERQFLADLTIPRAIELYGYSKEEYEFLRDLCVQRLGFYRFFDRSNKDAFLNAIRNCEIKNIKMVLNEYYRRAIFNDKHISFNPKEFPKGFVDENQDIFMLADTIPDDLKNRYYKRQLTIEDVINNYELFENIPFADFMTTQKDTQRFFHLMYEIFGEKGTYQLLKNHYDLMDYIINGNLVIYFISYLSDNPMTVNGDIESTFAELTAGVFSKYPKINSREQLLLYQPSFHMLDIEQQIALEYLGISNVQRFEQETHFFTHSSSQYGKQFDMLEAITSFVRSWGVEKLIRYGNDFTVGTNDYEAFKKMMANFIEFMRKNNMFDDYPDYGWMEGEFRDNNPQIFISQDAPVELAKAYYKNRLHPSLLAEHPECAKYLLDKDLKSAIRVRLNLSTPNLATSDGRYVMGETDFTTEYISRYGNERFLELCTKYGDLLDGLTITSVNNEIEDINQINELVKKSVYQRIIDNKIDYIHMKRNQEFVDSYPELFVDFSGLSGATPDEIAALEKKFYDRGIDFADIRKYPQLVELLKDKNLKVAFGGKPQTYGLGTITIFGDDTPRKIIQRGDIDLLKIMSNEEFLQLCARYGKMINGSARYLAKTIDFDKDKPELSDVVKKMETYITESVLDGEMDYDEETAPDFLKTEHPELFLAADAPEDLKKYFYKYGNNYMFTFEVLANHKDWMQHLQGKSIRTAILRPNSFRNEYKQFFLLFGEEKAIRLGLSRVETVKKMVEAQKVEVMKAWYDKTGGKFIPDYIVMFNIPLDDADKFLAAGTYWSNLMKIREFSSNPDSRDAMLKLAYSFGTFDQDPRGYKKVIELLTDIPKKLDGDKDYIIERIDREIDLYSQRGAYYKNVKVTHADGTKETKYPDMTPEEKEEAYNKMIEYARNSNYEDVFNTETLVALLDALNKEHVEIDYAKPIFAQLYRKNEDGSFTLAINPQRYPKTAQIVRTILSKFRELPILTPEVAHQLFSGFEMKYTPEFREFMLSNMNRVLDDPDSPRLLSRMQRHFDEIQALNSNRVLTWELAVGYVKTAKYDGAQVGSERLTEVASFTGYDQKEFETLQRIYNYGRQRVYSSIPRIAGEKGKFHYEILRLDDPLAMCIGTLSDCCQELGNCAEVDMEHSMVDRHGRVFIVKDELGNIVAQSWVWRNKDVLCFDNIEIPKNAFRRSERENPELGRAGFTDIVFEIYKQAAQELIDEDEKTYKRLLDEGKITREQYERLRLGKITVGIGNNDIKESLRRNAPVDKGVVSRPLPFKEVVPLERKIYLSDSVTQHIIGEREGRVPPEDDAPTFAVYSDDPIVYDDSTFDEVSLITLQKLELSLGREGKPMTAISDNIPPGHLVSTITGNYGLNSTTARIVMNPNFAIIFDDMGSAIKLEDIFYVKTLMDEDREMNMEQALIFQVRLALDKIKGQKEIIIADDLSEEQKALINKALGLDSEIDIERGLQ